MRIAVGADHAGTPLNEVAIAELRRLGHEVVDLGTHDPSRPNDYPDYAAAVAEELTSGRCERGLLICGSGVGVAVAANKVPGIRAGICHDFYSAHQGVEHDNMNVLCLGARVVGPELMLDLVRAFLAARFSGEDLRAGAPPLRKHKGYATKGYATQGCVRITPGCDISSWSCHLIEEVFE